MAIDLEKPIWLLVVFGDPADPRPFLAVQPATAEHYDAIRERFLAGWFTPVSLRQWNARMWPRAPRAAVDVVRGDLVRITTGEASIYTTDAMQVPPLWFTTAQHRHALVALLPLGTLTDDSDDDASKAAIEQAVGRGEVYGAAVRVRFDMPVRRPA